MPSMAASCTELASRDHTRKLLPLIEQVRHDAKLTRNDLDGIAYTAGPGLVGALMVGASTAHGMARALEHPSTWRTPHGRPPVSPYAGR